jgi:hypothetical protein
VFQKRVIIQKLVWRLFLSVIIPSCFDTEEGLYAKTLQTMTLYINISSSIIRLYGNECLQVRPSGYNRLFSIWYINQIFRTKILFCCIKDVLFVLIYNAYGT